MPDCTQTQQALSDELDKALLTAIKDGVTIVTDSGVAQVTAGAAYMNVARQRLKDLGVTKQAQAGDVLTQLRDEIKKGGGTLEAVPLPPLSDEPDDATDGTERFAVNQ